MELFIVGFGIQELKKLNSILIEIASEHKNLTINQVKALFFEHLEKIETRIALDSENNTKGVIILEASMRVIISLILPCLTCIIALTSSIFLSIQRNR